MFYMFYLVTLAMVLSHTLANLKFKIPVKFRHSMNNHIRRYGTFTNKYDNHFFKCSNKNEHVAKEPYFKVYGFMTVNNENKLLCYESYLHKMGFDIVNC